jgi:hypothetical protein
MNCWPLERLRCLVSGHRALSGTASYGGVLADGRIRDLHFCTACDKYVWIEHTPAQTEPNRAWNDLQI